MGEGSSRSHLLHTMPSQRSLRTPRPDLTPYPLVFRRGSRRSRLARRFSSPTSEAVAHTCGENHVRYTRRTYCASGVRRDILRTLYRIRSPPTGAVNDWRRMKPPYFESASCREVGGDFFFVDETTNEYISLDLAKSVCKGCLHMQECLEWAVKHENDGIWGGTTPAQRRMMRRELGITLHRVDTERTRQAS
jgi:WhiB family redox-sensing transcriptional regulator